jgi:hypothetical protein
MKKLIILSSLFFILKGSYAMESQIQQETIKTALLAKKNGLTIKASDLQSMVYKTIEERLEMIPQPSDSLEKIIAKTFTVYIPKKIENSCGKILQGASWLGKKIVEKFPKFSKKPLGKAIKKFSYNFSPEYGHGKIAKKLLTAGFGYGWTLKSLTHLGCLMLNKTNVYGNTMGNDSPSMMQSFAQNISQSMGYLFHTGLHWAMGDIPLEVIQFHNDKMFPMFGRCSALAGGAALVLGTMYLPEISKKVWSFFDTNDALKAQQKQTYRYLEKACKKTVSVLNDTTLQEYLYLNFDKIIHQRNDSNQMKWFVPKDSLQMDPNLARPSQDLEELRTILDQKFVELYDQSIQQTLHTMNAKLGGNYLTEHDLKDFFSGSVQKHKEKLHARCNAIIPGMAKMNLCAQKYMNNIQ